MDQTLHMAQLQGQWHTCATESSASHISTSQRSSPHCQAMRCNQKTLPLGDKPKSARQLSKVDSSKLKSSTLSVDRRGGRRVTLSRTVDAVRTFLPPRREQLSASTPKDGGIFSGMGAAQLLVRREEGPKMHEFEKEVIERLEKSVQDTEGRFEKDLDVTCIASLCVDVMVEVEELPPEEKQQKWEYMQQLQRRKIPESSWECGGNSNFAIAAARLGLSCASLAHVGDDAFGHFMRRVFQEEGVHYETVGVKGGGGKDLGGEDYDGETLVCWVMKDKMRKHGFSSRHEFNSNPAWSKLQTLSPQTTRMIQRSRSIFINGYAFDELTPSAVIAIVETARAAGTAIYFDPGPRTFSIVRKPGTTKMAFDWLLENSDVLLLTEDEAEALTVKGSAEQMAWSLLDRSSAAKWVVIKRGPMGCLLATSSRELYTLPGYEVAVSDTVGCGDSFAAAVVLGRVRGDCPAAILALANAVGAATAMGVGAGRNVARAAAVAEILLGLQAEEGQEGGEAWNEEQWLADRNRQFNVAKIGLRGAAGVPLGDSFSECAKKAEELLHQSLLHARMAKVLSHELLKVEDIPTSLTTYRNSSGPPAICT